jgi:hypothetical protein
LHFKNHSFNFFRALQYVRCFVDSGDRSLTPILHLPTNA